MRRERLRPAYSPEELAEIYPVIRDHHDYVDHQIRVLLTIQTAKAVFGTVDVAADLAAGDGAILAGVPSRKKIFGDYVAGWEYHGMIEDTIVQLPAVDLFVCTETIEHLDDPDTVLKAIRERTEALICSTPVDAWNDIVNPDHYWAWDRRAVEDMLNRANFVPAAYVELDLSMAGPEHYRWGIWACR